MINIINRCTYEKTKNIYTPQYWRRCLDCFNTPTEGVCLTCAQICHNNHNLGPIQYGSFFVIVIKLINV